MDIQTLNRYKEEGLLMNQFHPTLPLIIWNYTPECQYSGAWDEVTLICRGLVTDMDGNIISSGFSKFFNVEENRHIPTNDFEVFEKLDGQYIGVFWYQGEMVVNSRGSFTSPYAIEAKRILHEKYPAFYLYMGDWLTYCFELIGFERIVVSYPESDLILTGMFNNENNRDLPIDSCKIYTKGTNINSVKKFDGLDWKNIKELNWQNSEGFVVRFSNGSRCKIKFEDYIKLHRQMTNLSTRGIWEALSAGESVSSVLGDVPDEFYNKVHEYENDLIDQFEDIELKCRIIAKYYQKVDRKTAAVEIIKRHIEMASIIFAMLDGKEYSKMIWKKIEPKFEKL